MGMRRRTLGARGAGNGGRLGGEGPRGLEDVPATVLLAEALGVRLVRLRRDPVQGRANGFHYRLTSLRQGAARSFDNRGAALLAFDAEVTASRQDPIVVRIVGDQRSRAGERPSWS